MGTLNAEEVRRRSLEHIAWYRHHEPAFEPAVEIRGDIASGMLVSRGTLFISAETHPTPQRFEALLQHEIGTHLVTHFNGGAQPFTQLRSGLAGYEALQEGLAVLAEYLVGGLTPGRVRLLAARVLAVDWIVRGAEFVEVFRRLVNDWNFPAAQATTVAVRTFRGGGYIKDQVYLRGFRELVGYLAAGHELEPLYLGKIALGHLPYLEELQHRRIVRAPRLVPQFMARPDFAARLAHVRTSSPLTLLTEFPEVP